MFSGLEIDVQLLVGLLLTAWFLGKIRNLQDWTILPELK